MISHDALCFSTAMTPDLLLAAAPRGSADGKRLIPQRIYLALALPWPLQDLTRSDSRSVYH